MVQMVGMINNGDEKQEAYSLNVGVEQQNNVSGWGPYRSMLYTCMPDMPHEEYTY